MTHKIYLTGEFISMTTFKELTRPTALLWKKMRDLFLSVTLCHCVTFVTDWKKRLILFFTHREYVLKGSCITARRNIKY